MAETEQKKQNERIGNLVSKVMRLSNEDQMYVLGTVDGLTMKKVIKANKYKEKKHETQT